MIFLIVLLFDYFGLMVELVWVSVVVEVDIVVCSGVCIIVEIGFVIIVCF